MVKFWRNLLCIFVVVGLAGCFSNVRPNSVTHKIEDGAPEDDRDVSGVKDAVPENVDITNAGNRTPYTVLGKTYNVNFKTEGFTDTGLASWYGKKFHGCKTANGETYDMFGMTAAHKTLAIPTFVRVTNLENGKTVVVKVNDRGPFHDDRIIDLSYAAAKKLGCHLQGTAKVKIEVVLPKQTQLALNRPVADALTDSRAKPEVYEPSSNGQPLVQQTSIQQTPTQQTPIQQTYMQVGAFTQKENAVELQRHIQEITGHEVRVRAEPTKKVFVVLIGPIFDNVLLASLRQKLMDAKIYAPFPVRF